MGGVGVGTLAGATGAGYWDPITAAQASLGGFCCAAEYYSTDGVGRAAATYGTITNTAAVSATTGPGGLGQSGFVLNSQFTPVQFTGSSMATETSPGVMCPVSGGTAGVSEFENPEQVYQLEGQAFYACMAGMQRSIATPTGTSKAIQDVNVAKQKKCSETITKMMKMNIGVPASTPTTGKVLVVLRAPSSTRSLSSRQLLHSFAGVHLHLLSSIRCGLLVLVELALLPLSTMCRMATAMPTRASKTS